MTTSLNIIKVGNLNQYSLEKFKIALRRKRFPDYISFRNTNTANSSTYNVISLLLNQANLTLQTRDISWENYQNIKRKQILEKSE